jgi:UDP-N-acetylmuramoyl-tripeptide--D-alanyl-D-alanine ligase
MEAALRTLMEIQGSGEKIAVLGDMLELGKQSEKYHRELGKNVACHQVDRLYLLGQYAAEVKAGALRGGMAVDRVIIGSNHRGLARRIRRETRRGDWMLFKGSRGVAMEKVLTAYKSMGD